MAKKSFHVNTEPHEAEVGDQTFLFQPEVIGAEFASAYAAVSSAAAIDPKAIEANPALLAELETGLRAFLSAMLLPDQREKFADTPVALRTLTELMEWTVELYGGGPGNGGTGSSSGS